MKAKRKPTPMPTEAVHPLELRVQPVPLWLELLGGAMIIVPVLVGLAVLLLI